MHKLLSLKPIRALALYTLLDVLCVGAGMGVPFFCILLGLPVGWYIARLIAAGPFDTKGALGGTMRGAALTSALTLLLMAILWGPAIARLFGPPEGVSNFGMPLILFEPLASFIGWLVLMILISPFLQFLMTLFAAQATLLWELRQRPPAQAG